MPWLIGKAGHEPYFTCHKSYQPTHLLFKYYVSKLGGGWGFKAFADNAEAGGGHKSEKSC